MSKLQATEHIKKQYQKFFSKKKNAQELFDYITYGGENISLFKNKFGVKSLDKFIKIVVPNMNSDLYRFIKVK